MDDLNEALAALRGGGVIVYPTETVWGIGCDATDARAVGRVFAIKRRADAKAMISLVGNAAQLERWVDDIPEVGWQLLDAAVGPLTVVYDSPRGLAPALLAADGSAAFRVTSHALCAALWLRLGRPLVSTSANISGRPAPECFADIDPEILSAADYVCVSGRARPSVARRPSAVIKLGNDATVKILRP